MKIQLEDLSNCRLDIIQLIEMHYQSVNIFPEFPFNPDIQLFDTLNESNALFVFTLRDSENILRGYSINLKTKDLIMQQPRSANMSLFIEEAYRGVDALKLMNVTEKYSKFIGMTFHTWLIPVMNDFSLILTRRGYVKEETLYTKRH